MFVVVGLILLVAAIVVGVAGVLTNADSAHTLTDNFSIFGFDAGGSTGTLFLYGIVVGAIGVIGLGLLLAGARRSSRRGQDARAAAPRLRGQTPRWSWGVDLIVAPRDLTPIEGTTASSRRDRPAWPRGVRRARIGRAGPRR